MRGKQANYFLSIQLNDASIQKRLNELSSYVQANHPKYRKYLIRPTQVHLTISAMHLNDEDAVKEAAQLLSSSQDLVKRNLDMKEAPPKVHVQGIGILDSGRVVYANAQHVDSGLLNLVRDIRLRFWSQGYVGMRERPPPSVPFFKNNVIPESEEELKEMKVRLIPWVPHATLLKMRGADMARQKIHAKMELSSALRHQEKVIKAARSKGIAPPESETQKLTLNNFYGVPSEVYQPFKDCDFGIQEVKSIELMSMLKPKDKVTNNYHCVGRLDF